MARLREAQAKELVMLENMGQLKSRCVSSGPRRAEWAKGIPMEIY